MEQFQTKYSNTIREVSGLSVIVQKDDSILKVNTSLGPCTILLLDIPTNIDLLYNLHIIDVSNNASINNITINTALSDTINSLSTLVLDQNNGGVKIENLSQNAYVGTLNYFNAAGGTDEKVKITSADTTTGFLQNKLVAGTGVTLSLLNSGGNEQLQINSSGSGVYVKTNAELITEITSNAIVPDGLYLITDVPLSDGGVYIRGLSANSVSLHGAGIFLNNDFQNLGGNFAGIWNSTLTPTINVTRVGWQGLTYLNITGVNSASDPKGDTTNWTLQSKTAAASEYIKEIDFILYDWKNNRLTLREDKRNNIIENFTETKAPNVNSIEGFQWGNDYVTDNKVINNSFMENWNQTSTIFNNNNISNNAFVRAASFAGPQFDNNSAIGFSGYNVNTSQSTFSYNTLENESSINANASVTGQISNNILRIRSAISAEFFNGTSIIDNTLIDSSSITATSSTGVIQNNFCSGYLSRILAMDFQGRCQNNNLSYGSTIDCRNGVGSAQINDNKLSSVSNLFLNIFGGTCTFNTLDTSKISCAATNVATLIISYNNLINKSEINTDNAFNNGAIRHNFLKNTSKIASDRNEGVIDYNDLVNFSEIRSINNAGSWLRNIFKNNSLFTCNGNTGTIGIFSTANKGNLLISSEATMTTNSSTIGGLNLTQYSRFQVAANANNISSLTMNNSALLKITLNNSKITDCIISGGSITFVTNSQIRTRLTKNGSTNNWWTTLDMSDPLVHSGTNLTLSNPNREFGIFKLLNANTKKISTITGIIENAWEYKFIMSDNSGTLDVDSTAVATATALIGLIENSGPNAYTLTGRTPVSNGDNFSVVTTEAGGNPTITRMIIF